jgi:beta propeller repeat protein
MGSADDQQDMPAVGGTNVVWTEAATSATGDTNFDIYYVSLLNLPPAPNVPMSINLTGTPAEQEFLEDIDHDTVVWTHTSASIPGDIVAYNLTTNKGVTIASSDSGVHFEQPSIRGQWITFLRITTQTDVYLYDYQNGTPVGLVTNDAAPQARPRVGGGVVVYEDYNSGNADVLGYTIPNGPSFPISTSADDELTPDVDGNTVVYVRHIAGFDQLFAYDIASQSTRQLTTSSSSKVLPRISGSRIVWSDDRNGNLDLFFYDLTTNSEEPLVTGPGDQFLSDIDGANVVYTDNSAGFEQVYMFTFTQGEPPPPKPFGCDPKKTDEVTSPISMQRDTARPVYKQGSFIADPNKKYYVCVENGLPNGKERTAQFSFEAEQRSVLTPSSFKPNSDPPRWVAGEIPTDKQCHRNGILATHRAVACDSSDIEWSAALFGRTPPNHVSVSIRVSK